MIEFYLAIALDYILILFVLFVGFVMSIAFIGAGYFIWRITRIKNKTSSKS